MLKDFLTKLFNNKKVDNPIEEIKKQAEIHPKQENEQDLNKEELVAKLIELYEKNDALTGQQREISKEKLQKIPVNILKNKYDDELQKFLRLNLRKKVAIPEQNKNRNVNKNKNVEKGKRYEKQIGEYFEKEGYIVKYNGIEKGKKDDSIDLIAIKKDEIIFIQCKNWKENSKYKVSQQMVKAFIGDTYKFIEKNPIYKNYKIKRLFVISNKILTKSAYAFIKSNPDLIEYKIIKDNAIQI